MTRTQPLRPYVLAAGTALAFYVLANVVIYWFLIRPQPVVSAKPAPAAENAAAPAAGASGGAQLLPPPVIQLPLLGRFVAVLASCSLGVYFVHVLMMELLSSGRLGFTLNWLTFGPLIGIPLDSFVVLVLSIMVVWTMQHLPVLRWFVP